MSECKLHRSDNLSEPILSQGFRNNVCNYPSAEEYQRDLNLRYYSRYSISYIVNPESDGIRESFEQSVSLGPPLPFDFRLGEKNCQLYQAWEENAKLKKQTADGGLEAKTKADDRLLGQIELN